MLHLEMILQLGKGKKEIQKPWFIRYQHRQDSPAKCCQMGNHQHLVQIRTSRAPTVYIFYVYNNLPTSTLHSYGSPE